MRAIVFERYGSPDVLHFKEFENFTAEDNEVLVRVQAASVNALDWRRVRASPILVRFAEGLRKPKRPRVGADVSGRVEALGKNATEFRLGDEVFGLAYGAFAEYVSAAENEVALKPANVSHEAAAAVPIAAFTALQALRDNGHVRPGQSVLINGAGGGVGTFAVQIAKSFGAEVTAVTSPGNLDLVRSIGADHVMDYTREDFCANGKQYDLILDAHPSHSTSEYKRALKPGGVCVEVGFGGVFRLIALALRGKFASKRASKRVEFMSAKPNKKDLLVLAELLRAGKVVPVIDRRFTLNEVPEALRYVEAGRARGKVVITT